MELAMVGEKLIPIEQATISAHDRSVSFGDGVYEVIVCCCGKLFAPERHFDRLKNSLGKMGMLGKIDLDDIRNRVDRALKESALADATIYFQITRGQAFRSHDYSEDWLPGFLLTIRQRQRPAKKIGKAVTHPDWRWKRCDIKSLNLLANIMAKHAAVKAGAYEAIFIDDKGLVTEGSSTTVLIVKDKTLQTAPLTANILPGITRDLLLEWAPDLGLIVSESSFTPAEMFAADEVLITGTSTEVMGIVSVDGKPVGKKTPGGYTEMYQQKLAHAMYG